MPPKKLRYGWERRAWARPNDFLVDSKWTCYYTATGQGQTGKFYIKKAIWDGAEFKAKPMETIYNLIKAEQDSKKRALEGPEEEQPAQKKGSRTRQEAASVMAEAEAAGQIVAESGDRKRKEVVPMNLSEGRDRHNHGERETTKRNKAAAKSMKDELEELRKAIAKGVGIGDTGAEEEEAKEEEAAVDVLSLVARGIFKRLGKTGATGAEMLAFTGAALSSAFGGKEMLAPIKEAQQQLEEEEEMEVAGASRSYFNRGMTKKEYAKHRASPQYHAYMAASLAAERGEEVARLTATIHERDQEVARMKTVVKKLRKRIPGALLSWRIHPAQAPKPVEEAYSSSTRYRHLASLTETVEQLTHADPLKNRWLSESLYAKFGAATAGEASEKKKQQAVREAKDCLWLAVTDAVALLKKQSGRLDNHRRAARQVLLTLISGRLPSRLRGVAAADLGLRGRDLKDYSSNLSDLISGEKEVWYELRGKKRLRGRFAETPVANLEAAAAHWEATSVPSADKKNLRTNPEDKNEQHLVHHNYESVREKKDCFVDSMRAAQQLEWAEEGKAVLDSCSAGSVVVTSLYTAQAAAKSRSCGSCS